MSERLHDQLRANPEDCVWMQQLPTYIHCLHRGLSVTGGRDDPGKVGVAL